MSESARSRAFFRWIKFNLVGAIGIGVQLAALWCLTTLGIGYMVATAVAVEAAVLNNFLWHERFTWRDRAGGQRREAMGRLLRFNFSNGVVSIGGNLLLMRMLVGEAHLRTLVANLISIAACSLVNFALSDRWVFRPAASRAIPAA